VWQTRTGPPALHGKNIIITGAASGIGYYLVRQLLADGHRVTVLDLEPERLNDLPQDHDTLLPLACDVRDRDRVAVCVRESTERFGGVDYAIHNACRCTFDSFADTDEGTYRDVLDVNYFGALHLARSVLPQMIQQHHGRVIFTSSMVGVMGFTSISPYASSKGAIESLAKCLAIEYRPAGISFHLFHPPLTRTASAAPLPVPTQFMADPETVGTGLAKHLDDRSFVICHSAAQKWQIAMCYAFPLRMGRLMSRMTARYAAQQAG